MKRIAAMLLAPILVFATPESVGVAATTPVKARPAVKGPFNPVSIDRNKTRIFMPLRNVQVQKRNSKVSSWQMEVTSDSPSMYSLERAINTGALHHLRIQSFENKTYIQADWRYATPVDVNVRSGGLEIFFHHQKAAPHFRTVSPGVRFWEGQRWNSGGPMRVRVLRLDPRKVRLAPAIATPGKAHMGLSTVSSLARRNGAIAGVNGSFYSPLTGAPQGTLVLNRDLVSRTMLDRPGLWLEQDGGASIKVEKPNASISLDDGTVIPLNGVNETARRNRITLFTSHHGHTTRTISDPSRWEQAVATNGLVVAEGHGNLQIPKGGYVISGQGYGASTLRKAIGFGQALKINFSLRKDVVDAMGGGPTLIQGGQVKVLARQQHFRSDVAYGRAARTAVGLTRDGRYVLVTIDGKKPGYSVGASLTELAWVMREMGAVEALNLDGGGSTTMVVHGRTINKPSDGRERAVSTALLVVPRDRQVAGAFSLDRLLAAEIRY